MMRKTDQPSAENARQPLPFFAVHVLQKEAGANGQVTGFQPEEIYLFNETTFSPSVANRGTGPWSCYFVGK